MKKREKMLVLSEQYCEFIWRQQSIHLSMAGLPRAARAPLPTLLTPGSRRASLAAAADGGMGAWARAAFLLGKGEIPLRKQQAQLPQFLPPLQINKPRSPPIPGTSIASLALLFMQKHPCLPHAPVPRPCSSNI